MKFKEVNIKNRRATFDYAIGDTFTAGLVLTGTEIKSIRQGNIAEYFYGTYNNHTERRDRKLLLNRKEIRQLEKEGKESGFTIIPLRLFISDRGYAKLVIGIGKGKKEYDKRQTIREREDSRNIARYFQKK